MYPVGQAVRSGPDCSKMCAPNLNPLSLRVQFLFTCAPVRSSTACVQGLLFGQYATMIYRMAEQAVITAYVCLAIARAPFGPPGWFYSALRGRLVVLIALNFVRVGLALAMGAIMARLARSRVAPLPSLASASLAPASLAPAPEGLLSRRSAELADAAGAPRCRGTFTPVTSFDVVSPHE